MMFNSMAWARKQQGALCILLRTCCENSSKVCTIYFEPVNDGVRSQYACLLVLLEPNHPVQQSLCSTDVSYV